MRISLMVAFGTMLSLLGGVVRAEDKVDYAKMIVGKWEVTKADVLPIGATVEFTKDGKLKITEKMGDKEMTFEGTYKVEGDKFTVKIKIGDDEHTNTITITKISDKEMTTKDKDGNVVEVKRKK